MNKYLTKIAYIHPLIDEDFKERLGHKSANHPDYLPDPEDFTEEYEDDNGNTHSRFDHAGYYAAARDKAHEIEENNARIRKVMTAQESHVSTGYPSKEQLHEHYQSLMLPKISDSQAKSNAESNRSFGRGLGGTLGFMGGGVAGAGVGAGAGFLASKAVGNPYTNMIRKKLVRAGGTFGAVAGAGLGAYYAGRSMGNSMHSSSLRDSQSHNELIDSVNKNTLSTLREREELLRQHFQSRAK